MLKTEFLKILEKNIEEINYEIHPKIRELLESTRHSSPAAEILINNAELAKKRRAPVCQDTGMINIIVQTSHNINLDEDIYSLLNEAVKKSYKRAKFRASVFSCPIKRKELYFHPPIIQFELLPSLKNSLRLAILVRGGGVENSSRLLLLSPTSPKSYLKEKIKRSIIEVLPYSCPPVIIGIGIGSSPDYVMYLAKSATIWSNSWEYHDWINIEEELSEELKEELNKEHIGIASWGEGGNVAAVKALTYPTHVGTLPVGIYLSCYATRERVLTFGS